MIALAIVGICVWANGVRALVPLLAHRFNIDPALVSAPPDQHARRCHRPVHLLLRRHHPAHQAGVTLRGEEGYPAQLKNEFAGDLAQMEPGHQIPHDADRLLAQFGREVLLDAEQEEL